MNSDTINSIYIPVDLNDCLLQLDKILDDSSKALLKKIPEDEFIGRTHLGLGTRIRNNWNLWQGSRLNRYFNGLGIYHPEDISGIILISYHRKLENKSIDLNSQVNYYKAYWIAIKEPNKKNYPKGMKKMEFNIKQQYTFKDSHLPGTIHIQSNSQNGKTWIYDYYFGWKEIDKSILDKLSETNYDNREKTIREIYGK